MFRLSVFILFAALLTLAAFPGTAVAQKKIGTTIDNPTATQVYYTGEKIGVTASWTNVPANAGYTASLWVVCNNPPPDHWVYDEVVGIVAANGTAEFGPFVPMVPGWYWVSVAIYDPQENLVASTSVSVYVGP